MSSSTTITLFVLPTLFLLSSITHADEPVDLLLENGRIWTGDASQGDVTWVAIRGARIVAVGDDAAPAARRTIDLRGRLTIPGFNDSHVHFASAGALLLGVNLLDVNDDESFQDRIREAATRLPKGSWITGGNWGAYEAWSKGSAGGESAERERSSYRPHRSLIDEITPGHAVLVTRYDGQMGLANARALELLGVESETGILEGQLLFSCRRRTPEKPVAQRRAETRRGLVECRQWGVTSVQDMSPADHLERYRELRSQGELTCRIHFSPARLSDVPRMKKDGWVQGSGDEWIRFGTIKSHIDGIMGGRTARFFEPYADNQPQRATWRGGWREFSRDLAEFESMLIDADAAKIQLRVHAIGDEANSLLLDILGRIEERNGARDRRFRLVHAQVIHAKDFARIREHRIVAEVQPYHCTDDMRWMEERIGAERCRGAYAFRSLLDAGCTLAFGSDWPGTHASYYPLNPILGLYAAVTRQTVEGTPENGWFPQQRIKLEEALRAYTWGSAYATFEEKLKGTITAGQLADIIVLDTDLFETPPAQWLEARVDHTIVGGRVVFERK